MARRPRRGRRGSYRHSTELDALARQIEEWQRPVRVASTVPFRLSFRLHEPQDETDDWRVDYLLQGTTDPACFCRTTSGMEPGEAFASQSTRQTIRRRYESTCSSRSARPLRSVRTSRRACGRPLPTDSPRQASALTSSCARRPAPLSRRGSALCSRPGGPARRTGAGDSRRESQIPDMTSMGHDAGQPDGVQLESGARRGETVARRVGGVGPAEGAAGAGAGPVGAVDAEEIQAALRLLEAQGRAPAGPRSWCGWPSGPRPASRADWRSTECAGDGLVRDLLSRLEGTGRSDPCRPGGFQGTLRPYQVRGYSWLDFLRQLGPGRLPGRRHGPGQDDPGARLAPARTARMARRAADACSICPTSVVGNWQKEAARFTPELPVLVHHGAGRDNGDELRRSARRARPGDLQLRPAAPRPRDAASGAVGRRHPRRGAEHQEPGDQAGARRRGRSGRSTASR